MQFSQPAGLRALVLPPLRRALALITRPDIAAVMPSPAQFRAVLDEMAEAVLIYDQVGVRYVNAAGAALHGVDAAVLLEAQRAHDYVEYLDADGNRAVYAELPTLKTFITGHAHPNEVIGLRRLSDDRIFWVVASAAPLTAPVIANPVGRQVIVTYTDITEQRRLEVELAAARSSAEVLAKFDGLTGLPNRNHTVDYLIESFERAQASGEPVGLFFVDLDHFKEVNDSGGHLVGDSLLRQVSDRFRAVLAEGDLVGRFGGDEFAFVITSIRSADEAALIAERVLATMNAPFTIEGRRLHVTASVGIALSPTSGSSVFELLREADTAMYLAKELGRDGYQFFTAALSASSRRRVALVQRVREAVRTGGFELHYQPIVDRGGHTVALEALLRCHDEALGEIAAPDLIATARSAGLLSELGWWVMETAIQQLAAWRAAGHDLGVSVNVHADQLKDANFVSRIDLLLEQFELPPESLELEITEDGLVDDEAGTHALRSLRDIGIPVAIDDFGTGYSALTYLMRLPISTVKLDRVFIQQVAAGDGKAGIVGHVIQLAHSLGLRVVAEGIEEADAFDLLREHDCDLFQGYYFARPASPGEVTAYLDAERNRYEQRAA